MNSAKNDHICISAGGLLAQTQRITHKVGNVLNLTYLVIVGQDNSISFPL
jgi:hypothetical protein